MTWSDRLLSFLAAPEEPTNDPQVLVDATFAARERIQVYADERAERMERYAKRWPADPRKLPARVIQHRPMTHLFKEQKVG